MVCPPWMAQANLCVTCPVVIWLRCQLLGALNEASFQNETETQAIKTDASINHASYQSRCHTTIYAPARMYAEVGAFSKR